MRWSWDLESGSLHLYLCLNTIKIITISPQRIANLLCQIQCYNLGRTFDQWKRFLWRNFIFCQTTKSIKSRTWYFIYLFICFAFRLQISLRKFLSLFPSPYPSAASPGAENACIAAFMELDGWNKNLKEIFSYKKQNKLFFFVLRLILCLKTFYQVKRWGPENTVKVGKRGRAHIRMQNWKPRDYTPETYDFLGSRFEAKKVNSLGEGLRFLADLPGVQPTLY